MARQIAPGVLVVETRVADGKVGVIAGERIALAVDTGIDDAEGEAALEAAKSLRRPEVQLTYTHGHVDHAFGGTAFVGHEIVSRPGIAEHMRAQLDAWAERSGEKRTALEARVGWPTQVVAADTELDLGARRVVLMDTPGHAPDALCVYDPDHAVLFGGDTVVTAIPPVFVDGDSVVLEHTLRRLAEMDIDILVPGHGQVISGRQEVVDAIAWAADYLACCREHVAALLGDDREAVVAAADYASFVGERLPRDRHQMVRRHEQTIRQLVVEQARLVEN